MLCIVGGQIEREMMHRGNKKLQLLMAFTAPLYEKQRKILKNVQLNPADTKFNDSCSLVSHSHQTRTVFCLKCGDWF